MIRASSAQSALTPSRRSHTSYSGTLTFPPPMGETLYPFSDAGSSNPARMSPLLPPLDSFDYFSTPRWLCGCPQSCCGGGVTVRLCLPGSRSGLPCPVPVCCCRCCLTGARSGSHCSVELWWSRTGKGSLGGRKKGVV
jgi:hypothetical protein